MLLKILLLATLGASVGAAAVAGAPEIIRPCKHLTLECVRANFARNSLCSPRVRGVGPRSYTVERARFETPFFNASYEDRNLVVTGQHRCYISEFFINLKEEPAGGVLGIDCPGLNFASDRVLYQHRPLREDNVYNFFINGTYPMVRLTTSLANMAELDICKEYTSAEVPQLPIFHIDPKDRKTDAALATDLTKLHIYERELFVYRATMLARRYINSAICDFGC